MITLELAKNALRHTGIRVTPQRLMIVEALVENRTHPTVEEIYERVRETYPAISLATVYQTVALLARQGLVLELHGDKDGLRCDPETAQHAHAYCERCGMVFDLALPVTLASNEVTGFHPKKIEVSYYGLCTRCAS